jgi:O-antigen/teichoic acid export membrane protein
LTATSNERESSLASRAARGTGLAIVGQAASQGLRILGSLVLSHLLLPEAFGIMAIVNLVILGFEMISNVGIQPAIIRHPRGDDPAFLNTAWSLQVLRGLSLWLVCVVFALPLARFYGEAELARILPVAGLVCVLSGFFSTNLVSLGRRLAIGRVVLIDVVGQCGSLFVMVALAFAYRSVWALVAGGLVSAALRLLLGHVAVLGPRNRFCWEPDAARELISFGKWILVSTLFSFLASRLDVALLTKLLSLNALGVYSVAFALANSVRDAAAQVVQSVVMPALAESYREGSAQFASAFVRGRSVLLPAGVLVYAGAALLSPAFFDYLIDERYRDGGWIAQLLLLGFWVAYLQETSGRALLALGDSRAWAICTAIRTFGILVGCLVGFQLAGLFGLLIGSAVGQLCGYAVLLMSLSRHGLSVLRADAGHSAVALALGLTGGPGVAVVGGYLGAVDTSLLTLASGVAMLTPYAVWLHGRVFRLRGE